jgi:hypothetical protein
MVLVTVVQVAQVLVALAHQVLAVHLIKATLAVLLATDLQVVIHLSQVVVAAVLVQSVRLQLPIHQPQEKMAVMD